MGCYSGGTSNGRQQQKRCDHRGDVILQRTVKARKKKKGEEREEEGGGEPRGEKPNGIDFVLSQKFEVRSTWRWNPLRSGKSVGRGGGRQCQWPNRASKATTYSKRHEACKLQHNGGVQPPALPVGEEEKNFPFFMRPASQPASRGQPTTCVRCICGLP